MTRPPFSWMNTKLRVSDAGINGKGLSAREDIRKGELITMFGGYVMTRREEESLPDDFKELGIQISEDLVLSPRFRDAFCDADYINHSCSPNAGIKGQIALVAMRNIRGGGGDHLRLRDHRRTDRMEHGVPLWRQKMPRDHRRYQNHPQEDP